MSIPFGTPRNRVVHNRGMGAKTVKSDASHIEDHDVSLASRLKRALTLRGTNPNRVEIATGITRQTLYAVLNGQTENISRPILVKLCDHLGVRPEWMADGELPMNPAPALNDEEIQLIEDFKHMSPSHQRDLCEIASRWAEEDDVTPSRSRPYPRPPRRQ